jgi:hypothetical protein
MFPDKKPVTPPIPASLPQVNFPVAAQPALVPSAEHVAGPPTEQESNEVLDKLKLLTAQYGSNPYAFNMAFQQLKARYLLDHYHIDPNTEKH